MNIRLLNASDATNYWKLRLEALQMNPEAFAQSFKEAAERENPIEGVAGNISEDDNFTFGAFNDEELIGVVTLLKEPSTKLRHRTNIVGMYVSPQNRGKGIGEKLLVNAIQKARSMDFIEKINLTVVSSNKGAKKLYEKMGFKNFGFEKNALKMNEEYFDEELMVLFLKE